ncbi:NAD(P)/FAD-dependent oxidoreductase [Gangjinia marincola]|uniref:NAD(P)/FAD-dependent oxidoreductase n=1 Tax=Gangjinia marincola TaxID=578463 RepID=A0ABP3XW70_9FLAO
MTKKITKEHFDVFVIGSGTAGKTVAHKAAAQGKRVAMADHQPYGGTCANRGCDPKKVLANASQLIAKSRDLAQKQITTEAKIQWEHLQEFKRSFTDAVPASTEKNLSQQNITLYHQSPRFLDENTLSVEGKTITADRIVIATGMTPRTLHIPGEQFFQTSKDFLELESLPESMIFIGGGYVAMEFAHMAAYCGVEVTVIERNDRILQLFDEDLTKKLQEASQEIGITFIFNAEVVEAESLQKNIRVYYKKEGKREEVKARMVINASGRVPSIDQLDLENGNVDVSKKGVTVNKYLQSPTNNRVFACGDVAASGNLPLTPLSGIEGNIVADNILNSTMREEKCPVIPTVVFTQPQLATVGLSEEEAKKQNIKVNIKKGHVPNWYNAKRVNTNYYCYKTLADQEGIIVGAQLLSPEAGESINLLALAIQHKMTVAQFQKSVYTYPSWASDLQAMF